jgi:hypothetical protein
MVGMLLLAGSYETWLVFAILQEDRMRQHHSSCLVAYFDVGGPPCEKAVGSVLVTEISRALEGLVPAGLYIRQLASFVVKDQRVAIADMEVVGGHWTGQ